MLNLPKPTKASEGEPLMLRVVLASCAPEWVAVR